MENTKFWNPKKNYFVLLRPSMAYKSIAWIERYQPAQCNPVFCLFRPNSLHKKDF
jgi:hypothetical protein